MSGNTDQTAVTQAGTWECASVDETFHRPQPVIRRRFQELFAPQTIWEALRKAFGRSQQLIQISKAFTARNAQEKEIVAGREDFRE